MSVGKIRLETMSHIVMLVTCGVVCVTAWQIWSASRQAARLPTRQASAFEKVSGITTTLPEQSRRLGTGRVALIEFSDFQCPFCGQYERDTFPKINTALIETGRLQYAVRQVPLPIHPLAGPAAGAALCAADQAKYWSMHKLLFEHQNALALSDLESYGPQAGVDDRLYLECLDAKAHGRLKNDVAEAKRLEITSTPMFLLGRVRADGETVDIVEKIRGAQAFERIQQEVQAIQK